MNKTNIVYTANLSGRQLKNYLTFLTGAGFIKEDFEKKRRRLFITTSKGNRFLYHMDKDPPPHRDQKSWEGTDLTVCFIQIN